MDKMEISKLSQQLLAVLKELDPQKGYDLLQLGEHIGTQNQDELRQIAVRLQEMGSVKLFESSDLPNPVVVLVSTEGNDSCNEKKIDEEEPKSIIVETSVGFSTFGQAAPSISESKEVGRGVVTTSVAASEVKPVELTNRQNTRIQNVSIKQILDALASAIENSNDVPAKEKWPLIDKIESITASPSITPWLKAPLKKILDL